MPGSRAPPYLRPMTAQTPVATDRVLRLAALGLWLLPVYAVLLALGTLTHEPDHTVDFDAWSRYVTTDRFLVSHIAGSIAGAALGLVGVVSALVLMLRGPAARSALVATALTILGNVFFLCLFAVAAFAQPAIGRAHLAGRSDGLVLYDDVYGAPLLGTFAVGALCFVAGAILFGRALAGTSERLRMPGYGYAIALVLFVVAGFTVSVAQPVMAAVAAVMAGLVALRLPAAVAEPDAQGTR